MKPAAFDYFAPAEAGEVLELLARHGEAAKVLAGGQSLVPMLNFRLLRPACLVDINRTAGLSYIEERGGGLAIGARTRQRELERSALVRERCPLAAQAIPFISHFQVRNRGTLGGSLCQADPAAELPTVVTALGGTLVVRSVRGERTVAAKDFYTGYLSTVLAPDELLTEIRLPAQPAGTGTAFVEVSRRHGDFALAAVAACVRLDGARRCVSAIVVAAGVHGVPFRNAAAEAALAGSALGDEDLAQACRLFVSGLEPHSDLHASAAYRKEAARVLAARALREAAARAAAGAPA